MNPRLLPAVSVCAALLMACGPDRAQDEAGPSPDPVATSAGAPEASRDLCERVEQSISDRYDVRLTGVTSRSCYLRSPDDANRFVVRALAGDAEDLAALCARRHARVELAGHCQADGVAGRESVGYAAHLPERGQVLEVFGWARDPRDRGRLRAEFASIRAVYGSADFASPATG